MQNLSDFQKAKDYLICVDSDGCAMDTMDIKHIRCFGPCMVKQWQLTQWQDEILFRWNEVNLYTMTRGINRFKGLAAALTEVNDRFCPIEGVEALAYWAEHSDELSNDALQREIAAQPDQVIFQKALSWSNAVNASIRALPESQIKPFEMVKEALAFAHQRADVAIVSSANLGAVMEEWEKHGLLEHTDIVLAQNAGCDMFLFFNDPDEDFATMLEAYQSGIISEERMTEALTPEKYKRIMIVYVKGAAGPMDALVQMAMGGGNQKNPAEELRDRLISKGFNAFIYESPLDTIKKQIAAGEKPSLNLYFAGKNAIADFVAEQDLVITLCDVATGRPAFGLSKGGGEIPWYVFELPVVAISVNAPTMLADIPMVRTYINAYDSKPSTLDSLVYNLVTGADSFRGSDPIDSFCGLWDTRI